MKVAIVVGHNIRNKGAINKHSGISEYEYNEQLAAIIKTISKLDIEVVYRHSYGGLPKKINRLKPDYIISLHCNSFNTFATGTETLYYYKSKKGEILAKKMQKAMIDALSLTDRGIKPKTTDDRGGYLLRYTNAPCVILEPFFIDNNSDYNIGVNLIEELAYTINRELEKLI